MAIDFSSESVSWEKKENITKKCYEYTRNKKR